MSKQWTFENDLFLAAYFDAVGDYVGTHDLGRPKGAATARVKKLKACGAWDLLQNYLLIPSAYRIALGKVVLMDGGEYENALAMLSGTSHRPSSQQETAS